MSTGFSQVCIQSARNIRQAIEKAVVQIVDEPTFYMISHHIQRQTEVDALKRLQAETAAELEGLLPALLDKAFNKGEL